MRAMAELTDQATDLNEVDDIDLVMLLQAIGLKDRTAFEMLYDATAYKLYSIAYRITQQRELVEDVLSEVYLQVWRQAHRFDPARGSAMAWLTVLCRSRALDVLRKQLKIATYCDQAEALVSVQENEAKQPQDLLESIESASALHDALTCLDEQQRQLLALAYFRDYSHSQLASYTGLPLGTVKTEIRRGIEKLRTLMNGGSNE